MMLSFRCVFCNETHSLNYLYDEMICSRCVQKQLLGRKHADILNEITKAQEKRETITNYIELDEATKNE